MRSIYAILCLMCIHAAPPAATAPLSVYAAASTVTVLKPVEKIWVDETGDAMRIVYGSSGALARQISAGAPADIYLSANRKWIDYLIANKFARAESRRTILENRLALVAPKQSMRHAIVDLATDIPRILGKDGRLALGDPRHVPAGQYAQEALTALGIWKTIATKSARTRNVRLALALVQRGEASLGIVYSTDARAAAVRLITDFPEDLHTPIEYQAVLTASAQSEAATFLNLLTSPRAAVLYRDAGFTLPR